jgi:uncharacterized membrane protein YqjE
MSNGTSSDLGRAVQEVTEKAQLLVREEIALAKAEVTEKASKLVRGAIVGAMAALFALVGLLFLLHALAWGLWSLLFNDPDGGLVWLGYAILALILFLLGAVAALVALRLVKRGTPPTPQMAIEEAQLIRETVRSARPPDVVAGGGGGVSARAEGTAPARSGPAGSVAASEREGGR